MKEDNLCEQGNGVSGCWMALAFKKKKKNISGIFDILFQSFKYYENM